MLAWLFYAVFTAVFFVTFRWSFSLPKTSQFAIKGYIDFREENIYRHKARVLISSNGQNRFNDIIYIHAAIDTNYSFVQMEGNEQFERDFYGKYTNEYQRFKLIGGTLLVQATDMWKNDIEINITGA